MIRTESYFFLLTMITIIITISLQQQIRINIVGVSTGTQKFDHLMKLIHRKKNVIILKFKITPCKTIFS